jgi:hypothetical protein
VARQGWIERTETGGTYGYVEIAGPLPFDVWAIEREQPFSWGKVSTVRPDWDERTEPYLTSHQSDIDLALANSREIHWISLASTGGYNIARVEERNFR